MPEENPTTPAVVKACLAILAVILLIVIHDGMVDALTWRTYFSLGDAGGVAGLAVFAFASMWAAFGIRGTRA